MATPASAASADLEVTLRIISPSSDLGDFPVLHGLRPSTTVRQVRLKVEAELAQRRRSYEGMRLIYRGRMLDSDTKTLEDVIGAALIAQTEYHVLHLVLRDTSTSTSTGTSVSTPSTTRPLEPAAVPTQATVDRLTPTPTTPLPAETDTRASTAPPAAPTPPTRPADHYAEYRRHAVLNALRTRPTDTELAAWARERRTNDFHDLLARVDPLASSMSGLRRRTVADAATGDGTQVYILQSPQGPRAVLINGSGASFYTPSRQAPQQAPQMQAGARAAAIRASLSGLAALHETLAASNAYRPVRRPTQAQAPTQAPVQTQVQAQPHGHQGAPAAAPAPQPPRPAQLQPLPEFHANAQRPALPLNNVGALAAAWPTIWLVVRIGLFIWWFTTPDATWSRWASVLLIAVAVLVFNSGILASTVDRVWLAARGHVDRLLMHGNRVEEPGHAPHGQHGLGQHGQHGQRGVVTGVPDPQDVARRLVAQRQRDNGQRLMDFARSLERFGLLFLASLAPGIAERHIQLVQERDERIRRREQQRADEAAALNERAQRAQADEAEREADEKQVEREADEAAEREADEAAEREADEAVEREAEDTVELEKAEDTVEREKAEKDTVDRTQAEDTTDREKADEEQADRTQADSPVY